MIIPYETLVSVQYNKFYYITYFAIYFTINKRFQCRAIIVNCIFINVVLKVFFRDSNVMTVWIKRSNVD